VIIAGGGREASLFSTALLFRLSARSFVPIETRRVCPLVSEFVEGISCLVSTGELTSISAAPAGEEGDDEPVGKGKLVARGNWRGR
jgi:hypothetical protein